MASINKRYDDSGNVTAYLIRCYHGYDSAGKRLKPFTMTWTPPPNMSEKRAEKEAQRQAALFEEACRNGGAANSQMRLADFCKQYLDIMKPALSPATEEFYRIQIDKHIIPALGHMKLKDITTAHVQQYIQQIAALPKSTRAGERSEDGEKISPATVRRYLTVLQSVLKQAVKLGIIPDTPAKSEKLTIPKIKQPKIEIFTKSQAAEMLACLEKEPLQFQTLVQLAIFTGARRGELTALKFSDVDFENSKITIERAAVKLKDKPVLIKPPKDYEVRTVSVNPSCLALIKMLKQEKEEEAARLGSQWHEGDWMFTQWNGEVMNPQTPTKQFTNFLKRHGLPHRKFHCLRHTSATLLIYGGVNVKQVQMRLGHGDIETTNKYLHVVEEADAEAANVLDNMLLPPTRKENIS